MFRQILLFSGCCLFWLTCFSQSLPAQQIAPGVFYYFGDEVKHKPANCVWVVFSDYVLAIDANYPWGAVEILKEIKKTTSKPVRFLFDTHYHHDHSFGDGIFSDAGATIVSTDVTLTEMQTLGQHEWDNGSDYSGRNMKPYRRVFPTLTFNDSLVFDDGIHRVVLIKMGPAHTGGDGIAWLPKEKMLVTGDLFVNGNPWGNNVEDADADYAKWLKVLDKMAGWEPVMVIPGHGGIGTKVSLQEQRDFLADMFAQVAEGIRTGKSKAQMQKEIDLSKYPAYGRNRVSVERSIGGMYDHLLPKP